MDFKRVYAAGQRRVYLKRSEGRTFVDRTFPTLRGRALAAGFLVGAYHFARPQGNTPEAEVAAFLKLLPTLDPAHDLRPCLDIEYGAPSERIGAWCIRFASLVKARIGFEPVIYSYPSYLEGLRLPSRPGPLWLASFGRNDGKEYPYKVPAPWEKLAAHQYSSNARVAGVTGLVDISHVFSGAALAIPKGKG